MQPQAPNTNGLYWPNPLQPDQRTIAYGFLSTQENKSAIAHYIYYRWNQSGRKVFA